MDRRLPRAADVQRCGSPGCCRTRLADFDVVHDNQTLGYGLLAVERAGLPLVATIHHPITFDRRVDLAAATSWRRRLTLRRWYGFLRMQGRVARRLGTVLVPVGELGARHRHRLRRRPGPGHGRSRWASTTCSGRRAEPRVPGRIVAMASADIPMKGIATLLEAFAKLRTERDVELLLVSQPKPGGQTEQIVDRLGITGLGPLRARHHRRGARRRRSARPRSPACPRSTRGSRCRPSRRWPARRRWWSAGPARSPRSSGPTGCAPTWSPPVTWASSCTRWQRCSTTPTGGPGWAPRGGERALAEFSWRAVAEATAAAYQHAIDVRRGETHADR